VNLELGSRRGKGEGVRRGEEGVGRRREERRRGGRREKMYHIINRVVPEIGLDEGDQRTGLDDVVEGDREASTALQECLRRR
jgi:hypothetical protein